MSLLTLEEIRIKCFEKYEEDAIKSPFYFKSLIPTYSPDNYASSLAEQIKDAIKIDLPISFLDMLKKWSFDEFEIADFDFCRTGNYAKSLLELNSADLSPGWWEDQEQETRPENLLMIGQSDPFVAILDVKSGEILAYVDVEGALSAEIVASDMIMFIRGLGTIEFLSTNQSDIQTWVEYISNQVGDKSSFQFWEQRINERIQL